MRVYKSILEVVGKTPLIRLDKITRGLRCTIGAMGFPKDEYGHLVKGLKRHPTIKDNVVIYSGATILGGKAIIGEGATIGGNVWITSPIPPWTTVTIVPPRLGYKNKKKAVTHVKVS
jgi:serine O-acetyltransferase